MSSIFHFTLRFVVDVPVVFQSFSGFSACGVFYNLVRHVDEGLAESLHSSKRLAPWAATPFFMEAPPPSRIVYRRLPAPSIVNVSFSIFDRKVSEAFEEAILKGDRSVEMVNAKAKLINVAVNMYKFSEIAAGSEPLPDKFAIRFLTPTAFRRSVYDCCPSCPYYVDYVLRSKKGEKVGKPCRYAFSCRGLNIALPIPSLMFKNMARIWSTFSDTHLDVWEVAKWAENAIIVAGFPKPGIRTVRVYEHPTTNKWISGFMGTVRFAVREEMRKERHAKTISALLKMAELTNIGIRRTAGLGMIKIFTPSNEKQKE